MGRLAKRRACDQICSRLQSNGHMLRLEHSIVAYTDGRAEPDRLTRWRHQQYVEYARRMLAVYRSGAGLTRRELHQSIHNILTDEPDCDRRRIAAFCKLLDDRGEFEKDCRGAAAKLRLRVFAPAARLHPLVERADSKFVNGEAEAKRRIAAEIGRPWDEISTALYADVIAFHPLRQFHGYPSAEALLSRYNVAQLQACLYRAESVSIDASDDFKTILRQVRLCRLLHEVRRVDAARCRIDLSGPASVLEQTRRYGVSFARFVPALLRCRGWEMHATVRTPWRTRARLEVSHAEGLASDLAPPEEFDSTIEERFASDFGSEREGWRLEREGVILHDGQATFIPDFVLRHADGREVLLEIVGFWTEQYLENKRRVLQRFRQRHRIVLAVARSIARTAAAAPDVIVYHRKIDPEQVVAIASRIPS